MKGIEMCTVIITDIMKIGILWLPFNMFSKNLDQCFSIVIISTSGKNLSSLRPLEKLLGEAMLQR